MAYFPLPLPRGSPSRRPQSRAPQLRISPLPPCNAIRRGGRALRPAAQRLPQGLPPAPVPPPHFPAAAADPPPPLLLLPRPLAASTTTAPPRAAPVRSLRGAGPALARVPPHGIRGRRRPPPAAAPRYLPPPQRLPPPARPRRLRGRPRTARSQCAVCSRTRQRPCRRGPRVRQPARGLRPRRHFARRRAAAEGRPGLGLVPAPRRR